MEALSLFVSTFVLVFALGLQSLNVNAGFYRLAFINSFLIGATQMVLLKLGPNAGNVEIFAYLCGGPFGIITSMYVHRRWLAREKRPERGSTQVPPRAVPPFPKHRQNDVH